MLFHYPLNWKICLHGNTNCQLLRRFDGYSSDTLLWTIWFCSIFNPMWVGSSESAMFNINWLSVTTARRGKRGLKYFSNKHGYVRQSTDFFFFFNFLFAAFSVLTFTQSFLFLSFILLSCCVFHRWMQYSSMRFTWNGIWHAGVAMTIQLQPKPSFTIAL